MSARCRTSTSGRILGFLNYYVLAWNVDARGTPYNVKIRVNFEDSALAGDPACGAMANSDWDLDQLVEYEIDILTTGSTSSSKRRADAYDTTSHQAAGALKVGGGAYYAFKTPNDGFVVEPSEAAGLGVASWSALKAATLTQTMGYSISGSTRDGVYMDLTHYSPGIAKNFTQPSCNWPAGNGASSQSGEGCGVAKPDPDKLNNTAAPESQRVFRGFEFSAQTAGEHLTRPLYLAAKYGGSPTSTPTAFPTRASGRAPTERPRTTSGPQTSPSFPRSWRRPS